MSEAAAHQNIVTSHFWPAAFAPQWRACFDGQEERGQYGTGLTEQAAIDDLIALYGDHETSTGAS
jgi:hypothetical protein